MLERHHIIFKSQGGLDFELNYKDLDPFMHRGDLGPHKDREVDLIYKRELEQNLRAVLPNKSYFIEEVIEILGLDKKQAYKAFKWTKRTSKGMDKEDIIFRLLGNRYYL